MDHPKSDLEQVFLVGNQLLERQMYAEAILHFRESLFLFPENAGLYNNLGNALKETGDIAGSLECYRRALDLDPRLIGARVNLSIALRIDHQFDEAIQKLREVLDEEPEHATASYNLAHTLLCRGEFKEGFQAYESRWQFPEFVRPPLEQPVWSGESLIGKRILLVAEQGLGDTIQFCRLASRVKAPGVTVILRCQKALFGIFQTLPNVDVVIAEGDPIPDFDYYVPLLSLPAIVGLKLEEVPSLAPVPYLNVDPEWVESWQSRLGPRYPSELRVGIAWQGNPRHPIDSDRSIPLSAFAPLAVLPAVRLVSLQKNTGVEQIPDFIDRFRLTVFAEQATGSVDSFQNTAALMKCLDLVITIDSAPAHLAGALGVPVWLLNSRNGDWRWLAKSCVSPWYPTIRVFHQNKLKQWADVFHKIQGELMTMTQASSGTYVTPPMAVAEALRLALTRFDRGLYEEAEDICTQILAAYPDEAEVIHVLGRIKNASGNSSEAVRLFRSAIDLQPRLLAAYCSLGACLFHRGEHDQANTVCAQVSHLRPVNPEDCKKVVVLFNLLGRHQEAVNYLSELLSHQQYNADLHYLLGTLFLSAGQRQDAKGIFFKVLEHAPDHSRAINDLGTILFSEGDNEQAAAFLHRAIQLDSNLAAAYGNLGNLYADRGDAGKAITYYRRQVELDSSNVDALFKLGNLLKAQGDIDGAIAALHSVLRIEPMSGSAVNNLGNCYSEQLRFEDALAAYRRAVELEPANSGFLCNVGFALRHLDRLDDAVEVFRQAVELGPDSKIAVINLANGLKDQLKYHEAIGIYLNYLEQDPDFADAHNNLGIAYGEQDLVEQAIASFQRAIELRPDFHEAHNNLGNVLVVQGDFAEAIRNLRESIRLKPDYDDAHFNLSVILLGIGNLDEGFSKYEYRWTRKDVKKPALAQPQWAGEPIDGKTILLLSEQGLGDTLQFVRFANIVKQRGATVLLNCPSSLVTLLADIPGVDLVIKEGDPLPHFDVYAPLLSLPNIIGLELDQIPSILPVPYLYPSESYVNYWAKRLGQRKPGELRVGIAWQGNPVHTGDRHRSIPLKAFLPLVSVPGIRLISFQKFHGVEQIDPLRDQFPLESFTNDPDRQSDPFLDSAALMSLMDVIVTIDSAPVHLAGALGVPAWLACSFKAEWRWLKEREDSPWYPSVRIFRQSRLNQWDDVFQRIATELTQLARYQP